MTTAPFDPGLQPERTLLAWRRTILALAVGLAVSVRWSWAMWPVGATWGGIVVFGLLAAAYSLSTWRYRRVHRSLITHSSGLPSPGGAIALVTVVAVGIGIVALGSVVSSVQG